MRMNIKLLQTWKKEVYLSIDAAGYTKHFLELVLEYFYDGRFKGYMNITPKITLYELERRIFNRIGK